MEYNVPVLKKNYTLAVLKVINCFVGLTDYELDIISKMIDNDISVINKVTRVKIRELTGKDVGTTNNYIKKLKDKKVLLEVSEGLILSESILAPVRDGNIEIKFNVNQN